MINEPTIISILCSVKASLLQSWHASKIDRWLNMEIKPMDTTPEFSAELQSDFEEATQAYELAKNEMERVSSERTTTTEVIGAWISMLEAELNLLQAMQALHLLRSRYKDEKDVENLAVRIEYVAGTLRELRSQNRSNLPQGLGYMNAYVDALLSDASQPGIMVSRLDACRKDLNRLQASRSTDTRGPRRGA